MFFSTVKAKLLEVDSDHLWAILELLTFRRLSCLAQCRDVYG